jgi:hypothetical protein
MLIQVRDYNDLEYWINPEEIIYIKVDKVYLHFYFRKDFALSARLDEKDRVFKLLGLVDESIAKQTVILSPLK